MYSMFHDDITWCMNDCPVRECRRNMANMIDRSGMHSYANFKWTDECPVYKMENGCMALCAHAREYLENSQDWDLALRELGEQYCDHCVFSAAEED